MSCDHGSRKIFQRFHKLWNHLFIMALWKLKYWLFEHCLFQIKSEFMEIKINSLLWKPLNPNSWSRKNYEKFHVCQNCSWTSPELLLNFWTIFKLLLKCSWTAHEQLLNCYWATPELLLNFFWTARELPLNCSWTSPVLLLNYSWTAPELLLNCSLTAPELLLYCSREVCWVIINLFNFFKLWHGWTN